MSTPAGGGDSAGRSSVGANHSAQPRRSFVGSIAGLFYGIRGKGSGSGAGSRPFGPGLTAVQDTLNKGTFFVEGNHSGAFREYWEHAEDYTGDDSPDSGLVFVPAKDIEGVYLNSDEFHDPAGFWGRRTGGTQETFMRIAEQIPQVRALLDSGYGLDRICEEHPELENCVDIYYRTAPPVKKLGGFYVFVDHGRHRTLAAQAVNGMIPVRVIGRIRHR